MFDFYVTRGELEETLLKRLQKEFDSMTEQEQATWIMEAAKRKPPSELKPSARLLFAQNKVRKNDRSCCM